MFPLEIRELQKFHIYELIFLFIFPKNPIFFFAFRNNREPRAPAKQKVNYVSETKK